MKRSTTTRTNGIDTNARTRSNTDRVHLALADIEAARVTVRGMHRLGDVDGAPNPSQRLGMLPGLPPPDREGLRVFLHNVARAQGALEAEIPARRGAARLRLEEAARLLDRAFLNALRALESRGRWEGAR
ncbi:hypothetical protein [Polyangium sp. 6x1]|uniref:hypothetical protein n=1 Tax=Polyangium sp. 6x1 TaxID=3042689 RepID=UPI002482FD58|nr:hypothetical protein [Polyangium sp. 6x1]MDI1444657.1 hypothetical protein [Polyangium sp. 6x1]